MEKFLKDIAEWIRERPIVEGLEVSQTGYTFNPTDNQECIDEFLNVEQIYIDQKIIGRRADMQFAMLYNDILTKKGNKRLIENDNFIDWVATYSQYPSEEPVPTLV